MSTGSPRGHPGRPRIASSTHNSLLLVTFDESGSRRGGNRIVTLLDGAGARPGGVDELVDHYRLLRTIEALYGLSGAGSRC